MHELYLIRHGQAGSRVDYDRLSDLGVRQAELLGEWLRRQGITFDVVVSGALRRQQETARAIGLEPTVDAGWNEFDLDRVFAEVAPQLAAVDERFRVEYEAVEAMAQDPAHQVHRDWRPSDYQVVKAWLEGRFAVQGESWVQFYERIRGAFAAIEGGMGGKRMALVTSATPIGIVTAGVFGVGVPAVFELAGNLLNASVTVLRWRNGKWTLAGFNHTPHLEDGMLRTLR
jgi:broad specificity phosphatase PhoE